MTSLTFRIARFLPTAAVAVAALFLASCGSTSPPKVCNCPADSGTFSLLWPEAQGTPITSISTNPPCMATGDITGDITVSTPSAAICVVDIQLGNGKSYELSFDFRAMSTGGECGCEVVRAVDASLTEITDAGAD